MPDGSGIYGGGDYDPAETFEDPVTMGQDSADKGAAAVLLEAMKKPWLAELKLRRRSRRPRLPANRLQARVDE